MEYFPGLATKEETAAAVGRSEAHFSRYGYGLWAVTIEGVADFAGFIGICNYLTPVPFSHCAEIGWRLAAEHWGNGYATESARASLDWGFGELGLERIVAVALETNVASRGVLEKCGMEEIGLTHVYGLEHVKYQLAR